MDARTPDASRDAARDSAADAANPDDPGWTQLPGFPERCMMERAEHPERVFEPNWEKCPDRDGCLMLVQHDEMMRAYGQDFGGHDGQRGYFEVVQAPRPRYPQQIVLAATQGPAVAAWRVSAPGDGVTCQFQPYGMARDGRAAFFGYWFEKEDGSIEHRVYHAPLAQIGSITEPSVTMDQAFIPGHSHATRGDASLTTVALEVQSIGFVEVIEDGQVRRMAAPPTGEGVPQVPFVVGRHVFWQDWNDRVRVAHGSFDQATSIYLDGAAVGADIHRPATDGTDIAWMLAYGRPPGGPYDRVELWTSPYVEDPQALQPRYVADVPMDRWLTAMPLVGAGMFAYPKEIASKRHKVVVFDLATSERREFELPEAYTPRAPLLYITEGEVAVAALNTANGPGTVFRIQLDAMTTVQPSR